MISANVLTRRPLIGPIAGLFLVSACGTAAETTPTLTTPYSDIAVDTTLETTQAAAEPPLSGVTVAPTAPAAATLPPTTSPPATAPPPTAPPTTTPPTTMPPADPTPIDVVDVSGRTVFGVSVFEAVDVDVVTGDVSTRLGSPTTDSGWQPTVGESCAGSTDFRVLWWGDFRMTFERYKGDGTTQDQLSAWTVGDPTVSGLAPIGDVPPLAPSNIVTREDIGLGSTEADVEAAWANVHNGGESRRVVTDRGGSLTIGFDAGGQVVGFGDGPFDCPVDEMR